MDEFYINPEQPGSFDGVDAYYRAIGIKVSKKDLKKWLKGIDAYTLHKPA